MEVLPKRRKLNIKVKLEEADSFPSPVVSHRRKLNFKVELEEADSFPLSPVQNTRKVKENKKQSKTRKEKPEKEKKGTKGTKEKKTKEKETRTENFEEDEEKEEIEDEAEKEEEAEEKEEEEEEAEAEAEKIEDEAKEEEDSKIEDLPFLIPEKENKRLFVEEKKTYNKFGEEKIGEEKGEENELYPNINDPRFNVKIAQKKEFYDHLYEKPIGTLTIEEKAKQECEGEFEILPHQNFVRTFMSRETPYNSLLLYHELGTGKTCSAIGVAEETRQYMKQIGMENQILVIASPNVQENFKLQLFDSSKLKETNEGSEVWNLNTCVGSSILKEINPIQIQGLSKDNIRKLIEQLIKKYYKFMGYEMFAKRIREKIPEVENWTPILSTDSEETVKKKKLAIQKIRHYFDNRLIIIDEVHNTIARKENKEKTTSEMLKVLVQYCQYLRLLLLSATPMYNSHEEIVWLTNLMNANDKRSQMKIQDVFDNAGEFVQEIRDSANVVIKESGKDLLRRKLIGYVSYVRENPYTFPYRIYPQLFADDKNIMNKSYPINQLNQSKIDPVPKQHVIKNLYVTTLGDYQKPVYNYIISCLKSRIGEEAFLSRASFKFYELQIPLSVLNMAYPNTTFDEFVKGKPGEEQTNKMKMEWENMYGKRGLNSIMEFDTETKPFPMNHNFQYKSEILKRYGRIFSPTNIGKYSSKIKEICDRILRSTGIVLIYSRYIEGGLIPMALALEEMGFERYGYAQHTKSLIDKENQKISLLDATTMKKKGPKGKTARYVMITGQKGYSPNNLLDLQLVTSEKNANGHEVKVILISEAGSEGLDFKCIRQVHILDPWYNMNRIEQTIGRAVRNKGHCFLPFHQRNVEIYMHTTYLDENEEASDMYVYRLAENKALQIGQITRILKESAVDCLLNVFQGAISEENKKTTQTLTLSTSEKKIDFQMGDKAFSSKCDYMEKCEFECSPTVEVTSLKIKTSTYSENHLQRNHNRISKRLRQLYREREFYMLDDLIKHIQLWKQLPLEHIYYTLSIFLGNPNEWLVHNMKKGYLIKKDKVYAFQPLDLNDKEASVFERGNRSVYKPPYFEVEFQEPKEEPNPKAEPNAEEEEEEEEEEQNAEKKEKKKKDEEEDEEEDEDEDEEEEEENPKSKSKVSFSLPSISHQKGFISKEKSNRSLGDMVHQETKTPSTKVMDSIREMLDTVINAKSYIPSKNNTYYKDAKLAFYCATDLHNIPKQQCTIYFIHHILDTLLFANKLSLVEHFFKKPEDFTSPSFTDPKQLEYIIVDYFRSRMHITDGYLCLYMTEGLKNTLFVLQENWRLSRPTENENPETVQWIKKTFPKKDQILEKVREEKKAESFVGYIGLLQKEEAQEGYGFKIKNVLHLRNGFGARCDQCKKKELIEKVNDLMYFMGDTANPYKNLSVFRNIYSIQQIHLCIIYELLLRHMTNISKQAWFLSPEESIESDMLHLVIYRKEIRENEFTFQYEKIK